MPNTIGRPSIAAPLVLFCVLISVAAPAPADADDSSETDNFGRLSYDYRRKINDRLRGFGRLRYEELLDRDRLFGDYNKISTTGGVSYDVSKRVRLEAGLGLYYTYFPETTDTFETRLWQSATLDWPNSLGIVRRFVLSHRFRLEERFQNFGDWSFNLRFRYQLAFSIPINCYTLEPGAFYVPVKAEFFMPLGDEAEQYFADRARYAAGVGYVINKTWSAALTYTRQESRNTVGADLQISGNYIEFKVKTVFRIVDLLKSR